MHPIILATILLSIPTINGIMLFWSCGAYAYIRADSSFVRIELLIIDALLLSPSILISLYVWQSKKRIFSDKIAIAATTILVATAFFMWIYIAFGVRAGEAGLWSGLLFFIGCGIQVLLLGLLIYVTQRTESKT